MADDTVFMVGPLDAQKGPQALRSVSTWRQPDPVTSWPVRQRAVEDVASMVSATSAGRVRVAVDGRTGSGKTTFGRELAAALQRLGRTTLQASMDDFKYPWRHAREFGYDRVSGHGYYRNAYDFEAARELLLRPAGRDGNGRVVLCSFDPLTGNEYKDVVVRAPADGILIVDTAFAFRPEYDEFWDFRIRLEVDPHVAFERGVERDREREGFEDAVRVHRDRYGVAEALYLAEVDPLTRADLVLDNTDLPNLSVVGGRRAGGHR
jgi:uridine kinase